MKIELGEVDGTAVEVPLDEDEELEDEEELDDWKGEEELDDEEGRWKVNEDEDEVNDVDDP